MPKVLILAANPGLPRLRLDTDMREIQQALHRGAGPDPFEVHLRTDVRWRDLRQAIVDIRPMVLHFSGHGEQGRLQLTDDVGGVPHSVPLTALRELLGGRLDVRVLVLNACETADAAPDLAKVVDHVVAIKGAISDEGALAFSRGFYSALGNRHPIDTCVTVGKSDVVACGPDPAEIDQLVLTSREGARMDVFAREEAVSDPLLAKLLLVTTRANVYPLLPRSLANELDNAFPRVNAIVDIVSQADTLIQAAGDRIPQPFRGYRLRVGHVPLEAGAHHAWVSAVRDAAALSPYAVLAILLVAQEQKPAISTVNVAIETILSHRG